MLVIIPCYHIDHACYHAIIQGYLTAYMLIVFTFNIACNVSVMLYMRFNSFVLMIV